MVEGRQYRAGHQPRSPCPLRRRREKHDRVRAVAAVMVEIVLDDADMAEAEQVGLLGEVEGVPAMGLDGLASSAYGPEAALTILAPLGLMGLAYMGPVMLAVLVLLAILYISYWQTIEAYPTSGGSYTVAHENLGANAGLLAATALMIDYVLNVAVGISAGVGALTSAVPSLHPYTLWLCLGIFVLVTLINLRVTF